MSQSTHIVFCGGGSGGHLIPAIAIAEEMLQVSPSTRFLFVTSDRAIDHHIITNCGLPGESFEHMVLPLRTSSGRVSFAIRTFRSAVQCVRRFRRLRPSIVVGLGGFASIGGVIASWLNGIPIALLEQNTVPGRANRWMRRLAVRTFTGWPLEPKWRNNWRTPLVEVGVPLRRCFQNDDVASGPQAKPIATPACLVVLGGSQGAQRLNSIVLNALTSQDFSSGPLQVVHQTGINDADRVRQAYDQAGISADVCAFIDDMPARLASAALIISRSGAVTLAEIAACGKASVLFPLSVSADEHQLRNAEFMESCGAAAIVCERDHDAAAQLAEHLRRLLWPGDQRTTSNCEPENLSHESGDGQQTAVSINHQRAAMETAARKAAPKNAAATISQSLLRLTNRSARSSE
jgi:UDP-N-acetylglucosamine--N-acetylmuramyl-(pentapeptide) pyrophosphoryl-undecaprenol N-acetylglucosamine transferase